jgi:hypothetical protein
MTVLYINNEQESPPAEILTSTSCQISFINRSFTMSQIHYVQVPESDTEIIEETMYCRQTHRGMKIKQEQVPMVQPLQATMAHYWADFTPSEQE